MNRHVRHALLLLLAAGAGVLLHLGFDLPLRTSLLLAAAVGAGLLLVDWGIGLALAALIGQRLAGPPSPRRPTSAPPPE